MSSSTRPDYGLDAPPIVYGYLAFGVVGLVLLVLAGVLGRVTLLWWGLWAASIGLLTSAAMVYSSRIGKLRVRDRVLDQLDLAGTEDVLDLGCGSGLMLLGAAARLPAGSATGIDLWRTQDQAGSSREQCLDNAARLGVEGRITVVDGDITGLPFPDGSFDLVLASLAVHNLHPNARREQCLREAARVLRPGGRLVIIDIFGTAGFARTARAAGLIDVHRSGFVLGIVPPARVVTAART